MDTQAVGDDFGVVQLPSEGQQRKISVLVVSSVALAFISFWRAAAIVLCDLASTAYYIGGISEQAIGKAAPWFILGVMLFSYAVRSVYVESCTMFTRGGVYRVVRGAIGRHLAKLSVSALMFDYVLTGPISAVSAGQYLVGLGFDMLNLLNTSLGHTAVDPTHYQAMINIFTVAISIAITVYFWRLNIKGMHESSDKALRIMQLTTLMGIVIIGWSVMTMVMRHTSITGVPFHPVFTSGSADKSREGSSGWLQAFPRILGMLGILVAFGHSLLAMSGEESLAQVNREIEAPKLKNLLRAGFVIFVYSMLLTSLISFFAVWIIPDGMRVKTEIVHNGMVDTEPNAATEVDYIRQSVPPGGTQSVEWGHVLNRTTDAKTGTVEVHPTDEVRILDRSVEHVERDNGTYRDNLINGLVQYLVGPSWIKIIMECFVVIVGFLILAGAVNTSIIGSNGVMNRLAEDGILTPWFLHPQTRYGTTHRLINMIAILQVVVIIASWGDVNTLGEAYAFGVIWSFVFMTLAMVVFRFKDKSKRAYEVPLNIRIKRPNGEHIDLPIGISIVCLILLSTAIINLFTKKTATIWGCGFTAAFLIAFIVCEAISNRRRRGGHHEHLEQFNEKSSDTVTPEILGLTHPHPILVAIRNPKSLETLVRVISETDTEDRDVVVITCKLLPPMTQGITPQETTIDDADRAVLTRVVTVTEEAGKQVFPLVLPTNNPLYAIATAARDLHAGKVILGVSEKMSPDVQVEQFALAWGMALADATGEQPPLTVHILGPGKDLKYDF